MMKWLRTHTKQIMVVTVLLAMFSFVGGSALVQILSPNQDKEPLFQAFGHPVLAGDYRLAQRDTEILKTLGIGWQYDQPDRRMSVEDWCMLLEEAERAGVKVSDQEVEQQIKQIEQMHQMMSQTREPVDIMELMRIQGKYTPPSVRHAVRRHLTIFKHAEPVTATAEPSELQVKHYVLDTQDKIKVQFVALNAEKFVDPNLKFTPEELQAQFDKYKDMERDSSESGFGYKHPRRVKLQYAVANVKRIEPQLTVGFDEVKNYWKANKSKYHKVIYEEAPATSQATSAPTTKPAMVQKTVEKTLGEAKPDIERELRKKNAQRLAEQALAKLSATVQKPWLEQKTNADTGYKPVPASVQSENYLKEAAERIGREFGIQIDYRETGLLSAEELDKLDDLKNASAAAEGGSGMKLTEYVFRVPAFLKHEKGELGAESTMSLQLFQTPDAPLIASDSPIFFRQMTPPRDRLIVFRVVESSEAQSPVKLDEVRDLVVKDLQIAAAMKALQPRVMELCAAAQHLGLKDAWALFDDLHEKSGLFTPAPFPRRVRKEQSRTKELYTTGETTMAPPDVSGVGASQRFADQCFEMAAEGYVAPRCEGSGAQLKTATTRPAVMPLPVVRAIELTSEGKWCVVEKLDVERVDEGKYESELREQNFSRLSGERGSYLLAQWFKPDAIQKRAGYQRLRGAAPETREGIKSEQPPPPPEF